MALVLKKLLRKIYLDFYSIYFDIIDDIKVIAKKYKLSDNIKKYIENDIFCLAFSITKDESNKLKLNIAYNKQIIDKSKMDKNDKNFFDEIENLLFNNEYAKHIFQLK